MRDGIEIGKIWRLIVIRDGGQGYTHILSEANFKYGRTSSELERFDTMRLPSGLIQLVEDHPFNLYEEALETGFVVEMTRRGSRARGWTKFTSSIQLTSGEPFRNPRGLYSNEIGSTLEIQRVGCPSDVLELPNVIWLRVAELPLRYIAWAFENEILSQPKSYQKTLDTWVNIPVLVEKIPTLVLPGEPAKSENFI